MLFHFSYSLDCKLSILLRFSKFKIPKYLKMYLIESVSITVSPCYKQRTLQFYLNVEC